MTMIMITVPLLPLGGATDTGADTIQVFASLCDVIDLLTSSSMRRLDPDLREI